MTMPINRDKKGENEAEMLASVQARLDAQDRDITGIKSDIASVYQLLRQVSEKVSSGGRTNWQTFAALGMLLLAIILPPAKMFGNSVQQQIDDAKEQSKGLDTKLQKESALALESIRESTLRIESLSKERFENVNDRLKQLQSFVDEQTRTDLIELRDRRRADNEKSGKKD